MRYAALLLLCVLLNLRCALADHRPQRLEHDSFGKIVQAHRGEPFVVVLWSLDCEYCLESFKTLENAQRQTGLKVVSIATDRADDEQASKLIAEKIRSSGLQAESWAFGAAPAEKLRYVIDPKWRGEMPRSYWFNREGQAAGYSGLITTAVVDRFQKKNK